MKRSLNSNQQVYGGSRHGGKTQQQLRAIQWIKKYRPGTGINYVTAGRTYTADEIEISKKPNGALAINFKSA